jgi:hypothetical protein
MNAVPNDDTDPTSVTYYADTNKSGTFGDSGDIAFFSLSLDQDDNSGAGSYTFTVLHDPPSNVTNFVFTDLPSGQNLFGIVAANKTDPTAGGILVFPGNPLLNPDGTMANGSGTINTSKGGGPVTIGNANQAFDHNYEGAWFVYVDNPAPSATGGVGLTQTSADDADTIAFDGTIGVNDASVTIVQASGAGTTKRPGPSMQITAYDLSLGTVNGTAGEDLVKDPTANDAQVSIIEVIVKDANGNVVEDRTNDLNGANNGGSLANGSTDHTVGISFVLDDDGGTPADHTDDIYSVLVSQLKAGYTVEFVTDGNHDAALVQNVSGSFDIGGFSLIQNNDTPDQFFEFTAQATDGDGDAVQACWEIGVDGTGSFDGDNTLNTTVTGIEPGQASDCVLI